MKTRFVAFLVLAATVVPGFHAAEPARKADPEATKLLADARAARANWDHFPGFHADLEVNVDGKVFHAPLTVTDCRQGPFQDR